MSTKKFQKKTSAVETYRILIKQNLPFVDRISAGQSVSALSFAGDFQIAREQALSRFPGPQRISLSKLPYGPSPVDRLSCQSLDLDWASVGRALSSCGWTLVWRGFAGDVAGIEPDLLPSGRHFARLRVWPNWSAVPNHGPVTPCLRLARPMRPSMFSSPTSIKPAREKLKLIASLLDSEFPGQTSAAAEKITASYSKVGT